MTIKALKIANKIFMNLTPASTDCLRKITIEAQYCLVKSQVCEVGGMIAILSRKRSDAMVTVIGLL